jgi:hypothetical protein
MNSSGGPSDDAGAVADVIFQAPSGYDIKDYRNLSQSLAQAQDAMKNYFKVIITVRGSSSLLITNTTKFEFNTINQ